MRRRIGIAPAVLAITAAVVLSGCSPSVDSASLPRPITALPSGALPTSTIINTSGLAVPTVNVNDPASPVRLVPGCELATESYLAALHYRLTTVPESTTARFVHGDGLNAVDCDFRVDTAARAQYGYPGGSDVTFWLVAADGNEHAESALTTRLHDLEAGHQSSYGLLREGQNYLADSCTPGDSVYDVACVMGDNLGATGASWAAYVDISPLPASTGPQVRGVDFDQVLVDWLRALNFSGDVTAYR